MCSDAVIGRLYRCPLSPSKIAFIRSATCPVTIITASAGDLLHPRREPGDILEQIRRSQGQPQLSGAIPARSPVPTGGNVIQRSWLRFYDEEGQAGALRTHDSVVGHGEHAWRAQ